MRSGEDVETNVALAERLLGEAADGDADLAALPEVFTYLGSAAGRAAAAEPVPGPTTERLAAIARARRMWVLGGSVIESAGDRRLRHVGPARSRRRAGRDVPEDPSVRRGPAGPAAVPRVGDVHRRAISS